VTLLPFCSSVRPRYSCSVLAAQVALLHLLDREPASSKEVAEKLGAAAPAMSRLVDDLVSRRQVTRTEADHDRRVRILALNAAGKRLVDRISEARVRQILSTIDGVPQALRAAVFAAMQAFEFSRRGGKP
jgi:DNA-binding MarR family transcriptional regulator